MRAVFRLKISRTELVIAWIRCSGRTLRGRFELPRALRPTRSQVWRVRPGFATSAASHRPKQEIPSPVRSSGGKQWLRIEFHRDDRLHECVRVEDPRMDLAESTEIASLRPHDGRSSG